jgi:hypothetical protein
VDVVEEFGGEVDPLRGLMGDSREEDGGVGGSENEEAECYYQ